MKRIITSLLLGLLGAGALVAQSSTENHQLTALWRQYEEARDDDRPQKEAELLQTIKREAQSRKLAADFFDAATLYVQTVERRDWKQRDSLRSQLEREVRAYNQPLVTFLWMEQCKYSPGEKLWEYANEHRRALEREREVSLYKDLNSYLGGALPPYICSDWEYVLWHMLSYYPALRNKLKEALRECVRGRYPNEAALDIVMEYDKRWKDSEWEERYASIERLAGKYEGKAVAFYPKAELLALRKEKLDKEKAADTAFKALYNDARALEHARKALKGPEAQIAMGCTYPAQLMELLTEPDLDLCVRDRQINVQFQNLSRATLILSKEGKTLQQWKLENPRRSFYVQDTVKVALPQLPDGEYWLEVSEGEVSAETRYDQFTLSIATCLDSRGYCVYVARYDSGKPLEKAQLRLLRNGKELALTTLKLDGFTPLPQAFTAVMEPNRYYTLEVISGEQKSPEISLGRAVERQSYETQRRCYIYKDQGAYRPGDTLRFKAIVFEGDPSQALQVCKDTKVEMRLHDSADKVLETLNLTTNEFGAVSGSFVLPKGLRNGRFELEAVGLGYDWFRVDEFVLPSFDLRFDPVDKLYLVGDEIPVSGKLESYSGHPLQGAKLRYKVQLYGTDVLEGEAPVSAQDTFRFTFQAAKWGLYHIEVKVTVPGGETKSFSKSCSVRETFSVRETVHDALPGAVLKTASSREGSRYALVSSALAMTFQALDGDRDPVPVPIQYRLMKADGTLLATGSAASGEKVHFDLPGSGEYKAVATAKAVMASGKEVLAEKVVHLFCLLPQDTQLDTALRRVFLPGPATVPEGGQVEARMGTTEGVAYALATLYGKDAKVLSCRCVEVTNGTLERVCFPYLESYPDAVRLKVFYFIGGEAVQYDGEFRREKDRYSLPLQFTRFQDKAYPGTRYTFTAKVAPGTEVLAAAWDKSLDSVSANDWPMVTLRDYSVADVRISSECGREESRRSIDYLRRRAKGTKNAAESGLVMAYMAAAPSESAEDEAVPFQQVETKPSFGTVGAGKVREHFASALTFQPHLMPSAEGTLDFHFQTSDFLSTYYVRLYAHDKAMHNATQTREMVVSLPVKVSLTEPRQLYAGDVWEAAVTVSSVADAPVQGTVGIMCEALGQQLPITVQPGKSVTHRFRMAVPDGLEQLTVTAAFVADAFSDAVRLSVPVLPAAQVLTESHSAVLPDGASREELLAQLQSRFVNVSASQASLKEISVLDMVRDAIPSHVEPSGKDVLSLSEAWYVQQLATRLRGLSGADAPESLAGPALSGADAPQLSEGTAFSVANNRADAPEKASPSSLGVTGVSGAELLEKVLACQNTDGGFAWFEGMGSSPVITAVVLERMAKLRARGFEVPDMESAVKYLDKIQFGPAMEIWRGGLSYAQYMHVRAMYGEVPFSVVLDGSATAKKRLAEFKKDAKSYLTPSKKDGRGLQGQILAKARRILTLRNLLASEAGVALAQSWGISLSAQRKLKASLKADEQSLLEYAVRHRDGGWYYPNAVMPWRGLLEGEAYAHALLCELLGNSASGTSQEASVVADGIRLWLMLQKETQHWDAEPAFVDAITAVLDGSSAVLGTKVLALSATYESPFACVKASGNGFTVQRRFFREGNDAGLEEIKPGEKVEVGEIIVAQYAIWSAENRSFVRVLAGREASLQPVQQLSGPIGSGFLRPVRSGAMWGFAVQGYRNVKAGATEYFFDSYPEQNTILQEAFYVVQAGSFQAPVVVVESLYAPHYRANSSWGGPLVSRAE